MGKSKDLAIVWLVNDLRIYDNAALYSAFNNHENVNVVFIYDESKYGANSKWWLYHSLCDLKRSLLEHGVELIIKAGDYLEQVNKVIHETSTGHLYYNKQNDIKLIEMIKDVEGVELHECDGNYLINPEDIKKPMYKVFTPFWKYSSNYIKAFPIHKTPKFSAQKSEAKSLDIDQILKPISSKAMEERWMINETAARKKLEEFATSKLKSYDEERNIPSLLTSNLSPYLHFGNLSIREVYYHTKENSRFTNELGWREFAYYIKYHMPNIHKENFKKQFDDFSWDDDEVLLEKWQKGMTGYPIVDAGMRELLATGFMHNRVRMIVASLLTKNLFIDWRKGAEWFMENLVDADEAINSMNWQWVAGCGVDAMPYFRIFNPTLQSKKFDPEGIYIKKWVPELINCNSKNIHETPYAIGYPKPIISYSYTRKLALEKYKRVSSK